MPDDWLTQLLNTIIRTSVSLRLQYYRCHNRSMTLQRNATDWLCLTVGIYTRQARTRPVVSLALCGRQNADKRIIRRLCFNCCVRTRRVCRRYATIIIKALNWQQFIGDNLSKVQVRAVLISLIICLMHEHKWRRHKQRYRNDERGRAQ